MCVKFPLKDVVFLGKKQTSRHGDGQKWPPPAPAFSKGCGASDHVVDFGTNGWVPRTDGGVLEAGVAGCGRYFEAILPPKKLSHGHEKKEQKGSL